MEGEKERRKEGKREGGRKGEKEGGSKEDTIIIRNQTEEKTFCSDFFNHSPIDQRGQ